MPAPMHLKNFTSLAFARRRHHPCRRHRHARLYARRDQHRCRHRTRRQHHTRPLLCLGAAPSAL